MTQLAIERAVEGGVSDWGEVVTRYPYRKVRMDHLLSKENRSPTGFRILGRHFGFLLFVLYIFIKTQIHADSNNN